MGLFGNMKHDQRSAAMNRLPWMPLVVLFGALLSAPVFSVKHDDQNSCSATVSLVSVTQENNSPTWDFLFDITESTISNSATSTGSFYYDYTYFDANNAPHIINGIQANGWHPSDQHEFRTIQTQGIPDAVSIDPSSVKIHDIFSTDCSAQLKKDKKM